MEGTVSGLVYGTSRSYIFEILQLGTTFQEGPEAALYKSGAVLPFVYIIDATIGKPALKSSIVKMCCRMFKLA